MFRSKFMIPALSVVCLLASQAVVPTAAMASSSPLRAIVVQSTSGGKMVHLSLANNSGSPLDVKVGETPVTVAAGETVKLTAPVGSKITVATATSTRAAGAVLAEVSKDLSDATLRIN